jgi:hypothetical protein
VDRQTRDFSRKIPQRHIHRADRAHHRQPAAAPHALIEPLSVEGILRHEQRLQRLDQRAPFEFGAARRRA